MSPLISPGELAAGIAAGTVLVVDCRKELSNPNSGQQAYREAHIPGAWYADLDRDLSNLGKTGQGRHPLPDEAAFSKTLAGWGLTPELCVVAYDDAGGAMAAARLWWLLRLGGISNARVLDGGWSAWLHEGLPVDASLPQPRVGSVSIKFDPAQMVDFDALGEGLARNTICLLDARGAARFRGEVEPLDAVAGHVPGARNRPFSDNLDTRSRFKPAEVLAADFKQAIAGCSPDSVVHMCGSGVTACHNLLAMEHAGLTGSRLFAPSWSGWISDPTRPVAGPDPA
ncbi:MAG: sulfurtransferase [Gammaproteobacteria bacterium]|nr:MAG: sulfurtransferase [Gammaproteobacteria bacterium]